MRLCCGLLHVVRILQVPKTSRWERRDCATISNLLQISIDLDRSLDDRRNHETTRADQGSMAPLLSFDR